MYLIPNGGVGDNGAIMPSAAAAAAAPWIAITSRMSAPGGNDADDRGVPGIENGGGNPGVLGALLPTARAM